MKLSEWSRKNGIHPRTAERWFHNGTLPVKAKQLETGTILVFEDEVKEDIKNYALYARVSTNDQKEDLERQLKRIRNYASKNGYHISLEVKEIASGLNDNRKKLNSILINKSIDGIIIEHKDRLTRFGFNTLKTLLETYGREIIVINESECKDDIIQDFIDVITSMCSRIYGKRSAQNRKNKILDIIDG